MRQTSLMLLLVLTISACSSRVVYEPSQVAVTSPDAININTAIADELEKLPHIGRKTAEAIVEFRTANGPFRRIEHVMLIRGVSEARFKEIRNLIRIE
ncbi:MAG: helix-hairpin-helix domain-containing protein [Pyrinomonadaceae bacterium]